MVKYRIASNYGPGIYFFPGIFNQATKRDRHLLSEENVLFIICDASDKF